MNRYLSWMLAACLLLGMTSIATAQTPAPADSAGATTQPAPPPASETPATTAQEPAKTPPKPAVAASKPGVPAAELQKLDMLKGTWNSKVTMPDGSTSTGKAQYAWGFNGMHLEGDHTYTSGGKPMKGRTTWGWDAEKQQYQLLWVNSMDAAAKVFYGTFPNETSISFFTTYMMDGKAVTEKIAFTFPDPGTYVFTVENDLSGTMAKVMEETGTRGAANAKASASKTAKPASKPATTTSGKKKAG
jgi:hypothetical protein